MRKLVVGLILFMSWPLTGMGEEPAAAAVAVPSPVTAPAVPAAVPDAAQPAAVAPAAVAPLATPKEFPPGYLPWKAPQVK